MESTLILLNSEYNHYNSFRGRPRVWGFKSHRGIHIFSAVDNVSTSSEVKVKPILY